MLTQACLIFGIHTMMDNGRRKKKACRLYGNPRARRIPTVSVIEVLAEDLEDYKLKAFHNFTSAPSSLFSSKGTRPRCVYQPVPAAWYVTVALLPLLSVLLRKRGAELNDVAPECASLF